MCELESHVGLDVAEDILGDQLQVARMQRKPVPKETTESKHRER